MQEYYNYINKDVFDFLPLTFHIKHNANEDPAF